MKIGAIASLESTGVHLQDEFGLVFRLRQEKRTNRIGGYDTSSYMLSTAAKSGL